MFGTKSDYNPRKENIILFYYSILIIFLNFTEK